jgi:hypothetical protein
MRDRDLARPYPTFPLRIGSPFSLFGASDLGCVRRRCAIELMEMKYNSLCDRRSNCVLLEVDGRGR